MKGSEDLWNEEDLLTQMEEMQDQIEQLQQEKESLQRKVTERTDLYSQLERSSLSEILKLRSSLQQAQKKLQEQSDQIVRLSGADLILQDNERLKEENRRLQSEKDETEKRVAREAEAAKAKAQRREEALKCREAVVEQKHQEARRAVEAVDIIVKAEVVKERERLKKLYDEVYGHYVEDHEQEHKKILEGWRTKAGFSCYCIIWIMAVLSSQSPLFAADCKEAWKNGLKFLSGAWQQFPVLAEFASGWTVMIPWIPVERCIRFLVYWGTLACSIVMPIIIMILLVKKGSAYYKKQIAGWNSFWEVVIAWMVTIVLAVDIKGLLQTNLLLINLICHAGFCLWKTVVKKRTDNTAAGYSWK